MKSVGVIVEYNPFHNGHYYHIQETKKVTGANLVIAVMSGNFLQRGEPALVSKWNRTKMALEGGVDVVIELPYVFATQKADIFAYGAVSLLEALDVDSLCFGSEDGNTRSFELTYKEMEAKNDEFNTLIQPALKEGKSYPRAASDAFLRLQISEDVVDLSQPNNILGFHYIKAIHTLHSDMKVYTIKRTKANYHDKDFQDQHIASATSIRNNLFSGNTNLEEIQNVMPETTSLHLQAYKNKYGLFHRWEDYFPFLKYRLLSMTAEELNQIYEVEEGLENRVLQMISDSVTFKDFMEKLKTKRYTWTRLQRLCLHILTNTTKKAMKKYEHQPTYIRLLGMSLQGQDYLNKVKKHLSLPLVSRLASFSNEQIMLDIKATKVYASCLKEPLRSQIIKAEFTNPPFRYDSSKRQFLG